MIPSVAVIGEVQVYSRLGCCLNIVLARAYSCSKQKSSSCSLASFISSKPYSPTAEWDWENIAGTGIMNKA